MFKEIFIYFILIFSKEFFIKTSYDQKFLTNIKGDGTHVILSSLPVDANFIIEKSNHSYRDFFFYSTKKKGEVLTIAADGKAIIFSNFHDLEEQRILITTVDLRGRFKLQNKGKCLTYFPEASNVHMEKCSEDDDHQIFEIYCTDCPPNTNILGKKHMHDINHSQRLKPNVDEDVFSRIIKLGRTTFVIGMCMKSSGICSLIDVSQLGSHLLNALEVDKLFPGLISKSFTAANNHKQKLVNGKLIDENEKLMDELSNLRKENTVLKENIGIPEYINRDLLNKYKYGIHDPRANLIENEMLNEAKDKLEAINMITNGHNQHKHGLGGGSGAHLSGNGKHIHKIADGGGYETHLLQEAEIDMNRNMETMKNLDYTLGKHVAENYGEKYQENGDVFGGEFGDHHLCPISTAEAEFDNY